MLRQAVLDACGSTEALPADSGICSAILRAYCKSSGDPDDVLATWIDYGAPIGVLRKVDQRGIFPPSNKPKTVEVAELYSSPAGWANHASAEEDPGKVLELLQENMDKLHGRMFDTWEELCAAVGSTDIVLNKFGLITKTKFDGTVKYRIIWDLKDSRVNEAV